VEQGRAARGHVFNLGHGVLPDTDPGVLTHVVELVHELSARCRLWSSSSPGSPA
jgi:uroporphyrinogen decarboxylase